LRFWIKFAQKGQLRHLTHLEMMRFFQRAARRAGLPLAYSQGFNPHPRMSFAAPLPMGVAGLGEYLELELDSDLTPRELTERLNNTMPEGIEVLQAWKVRDNAPALMNLVSRARYRAVFFDLNEAELQRAVKEVLDKENLCVTRRGKKGTKTVDIRPGIFSLEEDRALPPALIMELACGQNFNVRPAEVICLIGEVIGREIKEVEVDREAVQLDSGPDPSPEGVTACPPNF